MSESTSYQPVACRFYDELGLRMMRGTPCVLVVDGPVGPDRIEATIDDLYTEEEAEFVRLGTGRTIRLDRLVRVDEVERDASQ